MDTTGVIDDVEVGKRISGFSVDVEVEDKAGIFVSIFGV